MIDPRHPVLSITRQCTLIGMSRSAWYGPSRTETPLNLALMKIIDARFMETPFHGSRQMAGHLCYQSYCVGRKRVRRLMAMMGLRAIYRKPRTTVPHPEHRKFPYLLRNMVIDRPDQVWCADITYIPMRRGFLYLVAIMDWATRRVLSWRLSNSMDVEFCIEALEDAMRLHGRPGIFNTDQGSQFTSPRFTDVLLDAKVQISMDGRGRWMDNDHDRTAMAIPEVRMRLPERFRDRVRSPRRDRQVDRVLQHCAPPLGARRADTGRSPCRPRTEGGGMINRQA